MNVSVVIPMYNSSQTISKTLDSIKQQATCILEVIIVNDGSTDNSRAVVEKYIQDNIQLNIILINQTNSGVSSARNTGIKKSKGTLIALLDSDDSWEIDKIKKQLNIFEKNPEVELLGCCKNGKIEKNNFLKKFEYLTRINAKDLLYKMYFITSSIIFKKEIINDIGLFDESQNFGEDAKFFIVAAFKKKCYLLNESLIEFGLTKKFYGHVGLSSQIFKMQLGEIKNIVFSYNIKIINEFELFFILIFSTLKFFKRLLIVALLKLVLRIKKLYPLK